MVRIVFLCGGVGKRFHTSHLCKPLCMLYGTPMFVYTLKPFVEAGYSILIAYHQLLKDQDFERQIKKTFPNGLFDFFEIPYLTEGAVETGLLAIQGCMSDEEPVVFFDNDAIYDLTVLTNLPKNCPFVGYSYIENPQNCYCYLEMDHTQVVKQIVEKQVISHHYGIGVYGFHSQKYFIEQAKKLIEGNYRMNGEFYFSALYDYLLKKGEVIKGLYFENPPKVLGTPKQVCLNLEPKQEPRSFLVHPDVKDRYPDFIEKLESLGHTVKIEKLDYDFVIDDRAINPMVENWQKWLGFYHLDNI